jgi:aryl-alcohol dehydrogenase-like predicted oxidoreductase
MPPAAPAFNKPCQLSRMRRAWPSSPASIVFAPNSAINEGSLEVVEQLITLAESAGLTLIHMALAFVIAHPALSAAIIGPRTMEQLDGYLSGAGVS